MTFLIDNSRISVSEQTGNYTLALGDEGSLIQINNAGATTITIPTNASVAFPIGTQIRFSRKGAGLPAISGDGGVTVSSNNGDNKISAQHAVATIVKVDTDAWILFGSLTGA
jgi:uncharacterized protein (AIM24 family)